MAIEKPIKSITAADLEALIASGIRESKTIEYKRELLIASDPQKRKFVMAVASFANASGGDLIFGLEAVDGVPKELTPLNSLNFDRDTLTIRDLLRHNIEPVLFGVEYKEVALASGAALVIRIPRSWNGPHLVTYGGENRFYARDGNGLVPMKVSEVRDAFVGMETLTDRVKNFRLARLAAIRAGELPVILAPGPLSVLHVLPIRSFERGFRVELKHLAQTDLKPLDIHSGWSQTHDLDGVYAFERIKDDNTAPGFAMITHSGCVEIAHVGLFGNCDGKKIIPNPHFEQRWIGFWPTIKDWLTKIKVEPPFAVSLSLLDTAGYCLWFGMTPFIRARAIQQKDLVLTEVLAENWDIPASIIFRPIFDLLWNACGLERSFNYDENGSWKPRTYGY